MLKKTIYFTATAALAYFSSAHAIGDYFNSNQNSPHSTPSSFYNDTDYNSRSRTTNVTNHDIQQDTAVTSSDDALNKKIRDTVTRGWLWNSYKNVSLNTANGIVTLEGTVSSKNDENKLISEVQKVDGVKDVKSHLNIINS